MPRCSHGRASRFPTDRAPLWLVDALDDEDVVRRARHLRYMFTKGDTPWAGPVGEIELLAFHRLFVGDLVDVLPHDHRAIEGSFADSPRVGRHARILAVLRARIQVRGRRPGP